MRGAGRRSRRGRLSSLRQRLGPNWSVRTRELLSGPPGGAQALVPKETPSGRGPGRTLSRVRKARKEGGAVRRKSLDVAERMRKERGRR